MENGQQTEEQQLERRQTLQASLSTSPMLLERLSAAGPNAATSRSYRR
jgi:hypothetical protein